MVSIFLSILYVLIFIIFKRKDVYRSIIIIL